VSQRKVTQRQSRKTAPLSVPENNQYTISGLFFNTQKAGPRPESLQVRLFVHRVLSAMGAEFLHLKLRRAILFVFIGRVVPDLAHITGKRDKLSHLPILSLRRV
jgi:hypothetical protein